jgi:hypothetical protein
LSRHLQTNYAISYIVYLHLMLHAYVQRFNVMSKKENILGLHRKVKTPIVLDIAHAVDGLR